MVKNAAEDIKERGSLWSRNIKNIRNSAGSFSLNIKQIFYKVKATLSADRGVKVAKQLKKITDENGCMMSNILRAWENNEAENIGEALNYLHTLSCDEGVVLPLDGRNALKRVLNVVDLLRRMSSSGDTVANSALFMGLYTQHETKVKKTTKKWFFSEKTKCESVPTNLGTMFSDITDITEKKSGRRSLVEVLRCIKLSTDVINDIDTAIQTQTNENINENQKTTDNKIKALKMDEIGENMMNKSNIKTKNNDVIKMNLNKHDENVLGGDEDKSKTKTIKKDSTEEKDNTGGKKGKTLNELEAKKIKTVNKIINEYEDEDNNKNGKREKNETVISLKNNEDENMVKIEGKNKVITEEKININLENNNDKNDKKENTEIKEKHKTTGDKSSDEEIKNIEENITDKSNMKLNLNEKKEEEEEKIINTNKKEDEIMNKNGTTTEQGNSDFSLFGNISDNSKAGKNKNDNNFESKEVRSQNSENEGNKNGDNKEVQLNEKVNEEEKKDEIIIRKSGNPCKEDTVTAILNCLSNAKSKIYNVDLISIINQKLNEQGDAAKQLACIMGGKGQVFIKILDYENLDQDLPEAMKFLRNKKIKPASPRNGSKPQEITDNELQNILKAADLLLTMKKGMGAEKFENTLKKGLFGELNWFGDNGYEPEKEKNKKPKKKILNEQNEKQSLTFTLMINNLITGVNRDLRRTNLTRFFKALEFDVETIEKINAILGITEIEEKKEEDKKEDKKEEITEVIKEEIKEEKIEDKKEEDKKDNSYDAWFKRHSGKDTEKDNKKYEKKYEQEEEEDKKNEFEGERQKTNYADWFKRNSENSNGSGELNKEDKKEENKEENKGDKSNIEHDKEKENEKEEENKEEKEENKEENKGDKSNIEHDKEKENEKEEENKEENKENKEEEKDENDLDNLSASMDDIYTDKVNKFRSKLPQQKSMPNNTSDITGNTTDTTRTTNTTDIIQVKSLVEGQRGKNQSEKSHVWRRIGVILLGSVIIASFIATVTFALAAIPGVGPVIGGILGKTFVDAATLSIGYGLSLGWVAGGAGALITVIFGGFFIKNSEKLWSPECVEGSKKVEKNNDNDNDKEKEEEVKEVKKEGKNVGHDWVTSLLQKDYEADVEGSETKSKMESREQQNPIVKSSSFNKNKFEKLSDQEIHKPLTESPVFFRNTEVKLKEEKRRTQYEK